MSVNAQNRGEGWYRYSHQAMATEFTILISHASKDHARQAARAAFELLDKLESEMSRYRYASDIRRLEKAPEGTWVTVGLDTCLCVMKGVLAGEITSDIFNICVGPLVDFWKETDQPLNDQQAIQLQQVRLLCQTTNLLIDPDRSRLLKKVEGVKIDLGGIGKGHALDRLVTFLKEDWGIADGILDSGDSSVLVWNDNTTVQADPWSFSMINPHDESKLLGRIQLRQGSVSGSGTYRKGQHIIDPETGKPVSPKFACWAYAPEASWSDVLSTAAMLCDSTVLASAVHELPDTGVLRIPLEEIGEVMDTDKIEIIGNFPEFKTT